jgi:hypothetical protein
MEETFTVAITEEALSFVDFQKRNEKKERKKNILDNSIQRKYPCLVLT